MFWKNTPRTVRLSFPRLQHLRNGKQLSMNSFMTRRFRIFRGKWTTAAKVFTANVKTPSYECTISFISSLSILTPSSARVDHRCRSPFHEVMAKEFQNIKFKIEDRV